MGILLAALSFLRKMSGKLDIKEATLSDVEIIKFGEDDTSSLANILWMVRFSLVPQKYSKIKYPKLFS